MLISLKGISMNQFKSFHKFLSNFEDFVIVVSMTNMMNHPIDKGFLVY